MTEIRRNSAWGEVAIERYLSQAVIPLRLACETPHGPLVSSLWFRYEAGRIWCATLEDAAGPDTLLRLIDRYLGTRESGFAQWLIAKADNETAICITPDWLTSWDFGARMSRPSKGP